MKLDAKQLRELEEQRARGVIKKVKRNPIYFILEDIYDTYNIGGLFRLADALAIEKIYLVGQTETPPNSRIKKASIGTYKVVQWEYKKTVKEVIEILRRTWNVERGTNNNILSSESSPSGFQVPRSKFQVIAVEQHPKAIEYTQADYRFPLALIFGNESFGVKEETLTLADQIVQIPMYGINKSLNVIVAAAIISYWTINKLT